MTDDWSFVVAIFERELWIHRNWYKRLEQYWI